MSEFDQSSDMYQWVCRDKTLSYADKTLVMGILNVTPDSFSDGGFFYTPEQALAQAVLLEKQGADILDIGAESTRPGSSAISADEELSRLIPALKIIGEKVNIPISIDTYKSKTASEALKFGASIINDVWGLQYDPDIARIAAETGAGVVIMANYTNPSIFKRESSIINDCVRFFETSRKIAKEAGIPDSHILYDPGIGFGTDTRESLALIRAIPHLQAMGYPILIGASRKRFIGETLGGVPSDARDPATTAVSVFCREQRAACVRVHDVWGTASALTMYRTLKGGSRG